MPQGCGIILPSSFFTAVFFFPLSGADPLPDHIYAPIFAFFVIKTAPKATFI